jgi:hypothetical protein
VVVVWGWLLDSEHLFWIIMGMAAIWFVFTELPKLIYSIKNTPDYDEDDNDPSGNDNIGRKPYDYM